MIPKVNYLFERPDGSFQCEECGTTLPDHALVLDRDGDALTGEVYDVPVAYRCVNDDCELSGEEVRV